MGSPIRRRGLLGRGQARQLGGAKDMEGCSDVLVNYWANRGGSSSSSSSKGSVDGGSDGIGGGGSRNRPGGGSDGLLVAHNEDVGRDAVGRLYFVRAERVRSLWKQLR